jgi:hypothetical protein
VQNMKAYGGGGGAEGKFPLIINLDARQVERVNSQPGGSILGGNNPLFALSRGLYYLQSAVLQNGRWLVRSQLVSVDFSLTKSFRSHYVPGVDSASNRNEFQEYFLGVKAAGA